jgi:crooked neck
MEEMLGNVENVRRIFENWMTWEPTENAWNAYLKFEER